MLGFGNIYAQFGVDLRIHSYYDDNLFRSPQAEKDIFTNFGLALKYELEKPGLTLRYSPDFFIYKENILRNFSQHSFEFDYFKMASSGKIYLFAGTTAKFRKNKTEYDYYNYNQVNAYLNSRMDLAYLFLRVGYNYRYRNYPNFTDISNSIHQFFIQANRSLPSKTTLIFEAGLGNKRFSQFETVESILQTYSETKGYGGKGKGRQTGTTDTSYVVVAETISPPSLNQATFLLRVTQSLYRKAGIFIEYRKQISLTDETEFRNVNTYVQDEELFDDPYSYESDAMQTRLTWLLPWSTKMILGHEFTSKHYISEQAYVSETDTAASGGNRTDQNHSTYFTLLKTFRISKSRLKMIEIPFRFFLLRNTSNSYWYDYNNALFSTGIHFRF
jgi:hypothetical protein